MTQHLFRIERHQPRGPWFIVLDGNTVGEHGTREEATLEAQKRAMALEDSGEPTRIECIRDDGSVSDVWFYGPGPASIPESQT